MPPWLWTSAFGRPVVPDEYTTQSGCENGTGVNVSGAGLAIAFAPRLASDLRKRVKASATDLSRAASDGYQEVGARITGKPCKIRLDRDDDMCLTGKRHDFLSDYEVGFDADGRIQALETVMASRCGYSADLSAAINDRHVANDSGWLNLPKLVESSSVIAGQSVSAADRIATEVDV